MLETPEAPTSPSGRAVLELPCGRLATGGKRPPRKEPSRSVFTVVYAERLEMMESVSLRAGGGVEGRRGGGVAGRRAREGGLGGAREREGEGREGALDALAEAMRTSRSSRNPNANPNPNPNPNP